MTTPDKADQVAADPLAGLKGRRRATGRRRGSVTPPKPAASEDELPPLPESHDTMTDALARPVGIPALDPLLRRRLTVVETGGHVPAATLDDYTVSPFDATEQIVPAGCRTPISRVLWTRGQHVRRDVFATYLREHPDLAPPENAEQVTDQVVSDEELTISGAPAEDPPTAV